MGAGLSVRRDCRTLSNHGTCSTRADILPTASAMTQSHSLKMPHAVIGRYVLYGQIASGGMATVHYGRLVGEVGFSRTVAIKRMHPHCAADPDFASMFIDEARLAARIRHPNVVPILDVVTTGGELSLVMDYIQGETLSWLFRRARKLEKPIPVGVVGSILVGVLEGLHAAHEAVSEAGAPLGIVHRDVSPQNIMVGVDGISRVLDFGIAKASVRLHSTKDGKLKGKLQYMAPEQIRSGTVDRRTDIYAVSVVLWEALAGRQLFDAENEAAIMCKVLGGDAPRLRSIDASIPEAIEGVVERGLALSPSDRFQSAQEMAIAIERSVSLASAREVGQWVQTLASKTLAKRSSEVAEIESVSANIRDFFPRMSSEPGELISDASIELVSRPAPVVESDALTWPPPRSRRGLWIAIGAALLLGALGAAAVVAAGTGSEGEPGAAVSAVAPGPLQEDAVASASKELPVAPVAPDTDSSSRPTPSATSAPVAPTRRPPRTGRPPEPTTPTGKPPHTKTNCNPPYTIDAEGFRVPKPDCL